MTALLTDHLPLLVFQAVLIAWFLALLWRDRGSLALPEPISCSRQRVGGK